MMKKQTEINPVVCFGEILWDMLPDGQQPGGAPLNVAFHLNKLGIGTSILSKVGDDLNGIELEVLMDRWGIDSHLVQSDQKYPTSEVLAKIDSSNEVTYEIVFPVAWDFIDYLPSAIDEIASAHYFVFGSLSSRNEITRNTLFKLLQTEAIKVFDINLRPPFYNRDLLADLFISADIVKFNEAELDMTQMLFGGPSNSEAAQVAYLRNRFNISEVIVTKGQFGATYYKGQSVYSAWGCEVEVKDTIGSGDSFLAAFIANHLKHTPPQQLINNAVAMGAFVATKKGGCPEYKPNEYENFKQLFFKPINKKQL